MDKNTFVDKEQLTRMAKVLLVQEDQENKLKENSSQIFNALNDLSKINEKNSSKIDELLKIAEDIQSSDLRSNQLAFSKIDISAIGLVNETRIDQEIADYKLKYLEVIEVDTEWDQYWCNVIKYADNNSLDMENDPFNQLMTTEQQELLFQNMKEDYSLDKASCDKYDYIFSAISGVITGFVDVFFVGSSIQGEKGKLSELSDRQAEKHVQKFTEFIVNKDMEKGKKFTVDSSTGKPKVLNDMSTMVQYLEGKYKVPYDAVGAKQLFDGKGLKMNASNHHTVSLAHSPGLEGLFFSIIDQFTNSGTYLSNGTLKSSKQKKETGFNLQGQNFAEKVFFATVNWIGHNMSDLIGSNTTVAKERRGTGLPVPFTQFFQMFSKVRFANCEDDIAKIARKVFENGYDVRHGAAAAIPVVLNELLTRFFWAIKQYFYHQKPLGEILKTRKSPELRRMLLVGHGCLCLVDGSDALIRSGGISNPIELFSRMNFIAWVRLAMAGYTEVKAIYGQKCIDTDARNKEMDREWDIILEESQRIF